MNRYLVLFLSVGLLGCPGASPETDAGVDAGVDSGTPNPDGGYTCTVEEIDDAGSKIISYLSMALDSTGTPHVAYLADNSGLKYGTRGASAWSRDNINGKGDGGSLVTLRVTPSGKAHLSYYNSTLTAVMYATDTSGSFAFEKVADMAATNSIALDATGVPQIAYVRNVAPFGLKLATRSGTTWSSLDIDTTGQPEQPSFAIDAAGKRHISYLDRATSVLRYATDVTGTWVAQTIDMPTLGSHSSLVLDSAGKVHVVYLDGANSKLKYATNASGAWVAITLDAIGTVSNGNNSLAIDAMGKAHVTFSQGTVRDLGYATNRSGMWAAIPLVTGAGDLGSTSSVAVDSARNQLHVAFSDRTTGTTHYAICR